MDGKRIYKPKHMAMRMSWYVAVVGIARTHPRLFALVTLGSYISAISDFVTFLGTAIDQLFELLYLLVRVVS